MVMGDHPTSPHIWVQSCCKNGRKQENKSRNHAFYRLFKKCMDPKRTFSPNAAKNKLDFRILSEKSTF